MSFLSAWARALGLTAIAVFVPAAGCGLGALSAGAWNTGFFEYWELLPHTGGRALRIDSAGEDVVSVELEGGTVVRYRIEHPEAGWVPVPRAAPGPVGASVCSDPHYWMSTPPSGVVDRASMVWCQDESGGRRDWAVLKDGTVVTWTHWDSSVKFLLGMCVALALGGGIGVALARELWRRFRRSDAAR